MIKNNNSYTSFQNLNVKKGILRFASVQSAALTASDDMALYVRGTTPYFWNGTSETSLTAAAGSTVYNSIGDATASGSIAMGAHTGTYTSATANWGGMIISNTHANPTAGAELLALNFTANGDADGVFLVCQDNSSADEMFKIGAFGATTLTGVATGTDVLTLTAGDITLTDGMIVMTTGGLDVNSTSGSGIDVNASKFKVLSASGNTTIAGTLDVAGTLAAAGDITVAGDLTVTGSFNPAGNWDVGGTLTVDEVKLDTDGSIAGLAAYGYLVSDNTGDTNLNCKTGKAIHLQVAGADEIDILAASIDFKGAGSVKDCSNLGFIDFDDTTLGAGDNMRIGADNSGDVTINAANAKEICLSVNGTDTVQISATELEMKAASDIQFLGNDGILDSAGAEIMLVEAVGSATTYLNIKNANDAAIELECHGGIDKGFLFKNDQDEELFELGCVATAVDYIKILPAAAAGAPVIQSAGAVDIGIDFETSEGEEMLQLVPTAGAVNHIGLVSTATTALPVIQNMGTADLGIILANWDGTNTEEILILDAVATAVDEITITSAAANGEPIIGTSGGDTDITMRLVPKGDAGVNIKSGTTGDAARPDLVFADDVNSGVFGDGSDAVGIATAGVIGLTVDALQNVCVGANVAGDGTAQGCLYLSNTDAAGAVAPAGAKADSVVLYSEETAGAGTAELRVIDELANDTVLSPHSKDGDYIIDSFSGPKERAFYCELEKMLVKLSEIHPELKKFINHPKKKRHGLGKKPSKA